MQTRTDAELLRDYIAGQSEAAFGEIVRRYAGFVYSAALRQVENPEAARDVAQVVFTDLARKAGSFHANSLLIGWLCHATRLASLEQLRRDRRRSHRERQAMDWHETSSEFATDWKEIGPALDEAIASLGDEDRNALLLRFFKNESLASVGAILGVSEDAAQKRVSRALEKLREFFAGRGINTTAAVLSIAITANGIEAAPSGLAASLTAVAMSKAAAGSSTIASLFTMTNMKTAILALALAGIIASLAYEQFSAQRQLKAARASAEQQAQDIEALRAADDRLSSQTNELQRLRNEAKDVLRLRAEIARLRQEKAGLKKIIAQAETNNPQKSEELPILIISKFISVPTEILKTGGWTKPASAGVELMDDHEVRAMLQNLETIGGMELLSQPRVQTANGVEASLSTTQQVPWQGTNINVGETLHLNPHYSTNSSTIVLDIGAELSRLIDTSAQQDGSEADLRVATITNSVTVLNGQSILFREDLPGEGRVVGSTNLVSGPKSLLVVLTPHLVNADGSSERLERIVRRNQ